MPNKSLINSLFSRALAATLLLAASAATAEPFYWTDWETTSAVGGFTATGTINTSGSSIGVTYFNPNGVGFAQINGGTDYWSHGGAAGVSGNGSRDDSISPYTSSLVDNAPPGSDIIALQYAGNQTLTFSEAIANPVFSFVSLNLNGYAFDQDFEILSAGGADGNACGYWGCGTSAKTVVDLGGGNYEYWLVGTGEPHGTLRFSGTFDELNWRSLSNEYWNGFTVGVQGSATEVIEDCSSNPNMQGCENIPSVPEPGIALLILTGMLGQTLMTRRSAPRSMRT